MWGKQWVSQIMGLCRKFLFADRISDYESHYGKKLSRMRVDIIMRNTTISANTKHRYMTKYLAADQYAHNQYNNYTPISMPMVFTSKTPPQHHLLAP